MYDLTKDELRLLRGLDSPSKVQDYLDKIPINHEPEGDTCLSPRRVIQERRAHCIEGAMLAALAFRLHGQLPLVLDLTSCKRDFDHVVALFKRNRYWGAVSKTNHAVLRYREPVYRTLRELVLSYFHEYFDDYGYKTLRSYSLPINLSRFDKLGWATNEDDNWFIAEHLADVRHIPLLTRSQISTLRKAHPTEIKAGEIIEWKP
ncbi:MAG: hypothetical protein PHC53_04320 [Patescibacteria group bacterium]|nr:hypothetical protein [Patescibacteria group bacterium]